VARLEPETGTVRTGISGTVQTGITGTDTPETVAWLEPEYSLVVGKENAPNLN